MTMPPIHLSQICVREWPRIILVVIALVIVLILLQPSAYYQITQPQFIDSQISNDTAQKNFLQTAKQTISESFKNQQVFSISTLAILFLCSIVHGAAGFSFALFMMALLVWNGFSLAQASIFTATNGFILSCFMVYKLRKHVLWNVLWTTLVPRVGGLMIGIFLLTLLNGLDKTLIRQMLGAILLITVLVQLVVNVKPRDHVHRGWFWSAFGLVGWLTEWSSWFWWSTCCALGTGT